MLKTFLFTTTTELFRILADALVYVKAGRNYSSITVADRKVYLFTMQLGQVERRIADMVDA